MKKSSTHGSPQYVYVFDPKTDLLPTQPKVKRENICIRKYRAPLRSLNNAYWHIGSLGRYFKWSIYDKTTKKELTYDHTSYGLPHFQFIQRLGGGYVVGPSATLPSERGQGQHSYIPWSIVSFLSRRKKKIFVWVAMDNIASIKGIEKVGFRRVGYLIKIGHLYKLCDEHGTLL